jgi:hypothetical protein
MLSDNLDILNSVDLPYATVRKTSDGIVRVDFKDNCDISETESSTICDYIWEMAEYNDALVLMKPGNGTEFDQSARNFSAGPNGTRFTLADAIVVESLAHKLIANFYLKINKPLVPTRVFSNTKEAEKWLLSFKK